MGKHRTAKGEATGWLKAQAALSRSATLPIVGFGLVGTLAAILQAWCLAKLIGPALLGRDLTDIPLWAGLFTAAAVLRAGLAIGADARGFEAGLAACSTPIRPST